jgi:hypothetical protein
VPFSYLRKFCESRSLLDTFLFHQTFLIQVIKPKQTNDDYKYLNSYFNLLIRLCTSSPKKISPKTEMAEIHAETNIIEKKDRRKEYRRNRDDRYEDRRNRDCRIFSIIYTSIFSSSNFLSTNQPFWSLF